MTRSIASERRSSSFVPRTTRTNDDDHDDDHDDDDSNLLNGHRDDYDDDDDDDDDASRVARARTSADIPRGAMTRDETVDERDDGRRVDSTRARREMMKR